MVIGHVIVVDVEDVFQPLEQEDEVSVVEASGVTQPQPVGVEGDVFDA